MKLSHVLSRTQSIDSQTSRKHTPWIASPLDEKALRVDSRGNTPDETAPNLEGQDLQFRHDQLHKHEADQPIFKKHHESSTIELFYDLFFVANLTTFTANHEIVSGPSRCFVSTFQ